MENYEDNNTNYELEKSYIPTITAEELLAQIREEDPSYEPPVVQPVGNVIDFRRPTELDNIMPLDIGYIANDNPAPRKNILQPILPEQGYLFLYAETGLGKTLFTMNLAYALANGGKYLKYSAPQPKRVLYVDGEMSYRALHERLMTIMKEQGKPEFPDHFYLFTPDKMIPPDAPEGSIPFPIPKICSQEGQQFYNRVIDKLNIDVLVLDNYATLSGFDDSDVEGWVVIQNWITHLKAIGKSVILIHHAGKNGVYRGTSRFIDTADTSILLRAVNKSADDQTVDDEVSSIKRFNVIYEKKRNFHGQDTASYEVIFDDGKWKYQPTKVTILEKIVSCLNASMSQREIAAELKMNQSKIHRLIRDNNLTSLVNK